MLPIPIVLRLARRLEATWCNRIEPKSEPWRAWQSLEAHVAEAEHVRRRLQLATAKNLTHARTVVTQALRALLTALSARVEQLGDDYDAPVVRAPDLCEWVKELRHLEAEFGPVEIRWSDEVIRVVTDPIELRDVPLGPFAIQFDWMRDKRSAGSKSFEAIALEPNLPSGRDDVTHPHVQNGVLCAGDAKDALDEAVATGRLVDAFLIVRSVLTTYNAKSPYVPLAEWDGALCADCGRRIGRESTFTCEGCECVLCDECAMTCESCSETRCGDCLSPCDVCLARHCRDALHTTDANRAICPDCLSHCARCGSSVPKDELTDVSRLCSACHSLEDEEHHDDESIEAATEEVAVPADAE